jgi:hypothetical protein
MGWGQTLRSRDRIIASAVAAAYMLGTFAIIVIIMG